MLEKTRAIALRITNYAENSVVAHLYTESFGLQSYLINGAKKPKAKIHVNMLQPLHLLELVVYHKDNNNLQRIKEAQQSPPLRSIPIQIIKSALAMFLNEVLYKVLKHQNPDPYLFNFIHRSILWLDDSQANLSNFHLVFLIKLSKYLGFLPLANSDKRPYMDLVDGIFVKNLPAHIHVLQEPHTSLFHDLMNVSYDEASSVSINHQDRIYLLEKILDFYKLHTENFGTVNSLYILEEIFH